MNRVLIFWFANLLFIALGSGVARAQDNSITGKIICGYQGWFNCYGDGSPVERWVHWSAGKYKTNEGLPTPGHLSFELYPEVSDYAPGSLFATGFANQGDGQTSVLFSSTKMDVIDKHFAWMKQYGIDGVALQRFLTTDGVFVKQKDTVALNMRTVAEKYQRIFYIMYDMKASDSTVFKNDLAHIETFNLTSSPYYAHQNGKPVICIWGFGLTSRPDLPKPSLQLIQWLKGKGYYVIGGVPTYWRTGSNDSWADYVSVYNAFDMISPWAVGRFKDFTGADNYHANVTRPDKAYCDARGQDYQPVIFPGFAWSNWNSNIKNEIPRNRGEFMWRQIVNLKNDNISNVYVAMFDEYDEGTAILKAADSYFSIPTNQYFLTTSADGTYISSDFYLRLVGKAAKVIKGQEPLTQNVSIPYSLGPIFFRTSVESGFDAVPNWQNTTSSSKNVIGFGGNSIAQCSIVTNEKQQTGVWSIKYSGRDNSATESYCYFNVFDVDIPVYPDTKLTFSLFPLNGNGRYVSVDLLFTDGTHLKDLNAKDKNGLSMNATEGRGTVNAWEQTACSIGQWANGKTIDKILIGYDHPAETGDFSGYIDDISIYTSDIQTDVETLAKPISSPFSIYPNPVVHKQLNLDFVSDVMDTDLLLNITDCTGKTVLNKALWPVNHQVLNLDNLTSGIYLLSLRGKNFYQVRKFLIQ